MTGMTDTVFLFDVDNTLLDNDRVQADLAGASGQILRQPTRDRYWEIFEDSCVRNSAMPTIWGHWNATGWRRCTIRRVLRMANWLVDYPFHDRLYPGAIAVVKAAQLGVPRSILSDGDAVFQPRKVERSGLWPVFGNNVLIFVHKELELADVENRLSCQALRA